MAFWLRRWRKSSGKRENLDSALMDKGNEKGHKDREVSGAAGSGCS